MKTFKLFIIMSVFLVLASCDKTASHEIYKNEDSSISSIKSFKYEDRKSLRSYLKYNSEGQIVEYKSFQDSLLIAHWIPSYKNIDIENEYFNNGQIRSIGGKKNNFNHGVWHYYNRTGEKASQRYFENGKKAWNWFIFKEDSVYIEDYEYIKDTGLWIQFYRNGQIKSSSSYIDTKLNGIYKSYFKQIKGSSNPRPKEIGVFRNNKKDGSWKYFNKEGFLIREENYFDGLINGKWYTYFGNGQLKIQGQFLRGKRIGTWKWYDIKQNILMQKNYKLDL